MMNSSCACNEMWKRALMTTAAQPKGAQRHVAIISNGLFSRKCVWVRYQISGGRASSKCAGLRETSGFLACLRHRVCRSRIVG